LLFLALPIRKDAVENHAGADDGKKPRDGATDHNYHLLPQWVDIHNSRDDDFFATHDVNLRQFGSLKECAIGTDVMVFSC
jgi:hypothetical protein